MNILLLQNYLDIEVDHLPMLYSRSFDFWNLLLLASFNNNQYQSKLVYLEIFLKEFDPESPKQDYLGVLLEIGDFSDNESLHISKYVSRLLRRRIDHQGNIFWEFTLYSRNYSYEVSKDNLKDFQRKRIDIFRSKITDVCVGLQSLQLSAWELMKITKFLFPNVKRIDIAVRWKIILAVKHFKKHPSS